jgi:hypothetical protein
VLRAGLERRPLVLGRLGHVDRHAAEGVGDPGEAGEVDDDDVVDADLRQLLHGLHHQRRAAEAERRVDLVLAVARDVDVAVAGDRDDLDTGPVGRDVGDHDRVRALRADRPGAGVTGRDPAVRPEQQDVLDVRRRRRGPRGGRDPRERIAEPFDVVVVLVLQVEHAGDSRAAEDQAQGQDGEQQADEDLAHPSGLLRTLWHRKATSRHGLWFRRDPNRHGEHGTSFDDPPGGRQSGQ